VKQALGGSTPTLDTTPPSISITAPANGATVSATIAVSANATDNVGVVGVQFKVDGNNIGSEDTSAPYSVSLNTTQLLNGTRTISAVARDAAGNTATASVTVSVSNLTADTTPPTISFTSPSNGATVSGTVALSANVSDNVGVAGVQFQVNGSNAGAEDTSAPYSVSWNSTQLADGAYTVSAVARDAAGNTATASVSVTVSNSVAPPPSTGDLTVFDDALQFPWVNASWSATVTFGSTENASTGSTSIKTALTAAWGALSLHHGAWGSAGISPSSYKSLDFAAHGGTSGTSLSIFFENDGGQSFPKVNAGTIAANKWTVVSIPMTQLNPNNQTIHRISIQDISGSARTFYVDNLRLSGTSTVSAPAAPSLASPANGATGVAVNPTLSWNASSGAASYSVQVSTSNTFSTTIVDRSGLTETSFSVSGLANGTLYYWRVNATNSSGTSGWSSVASFTTVAPTPDTTPPTVAFTAPQNGATVSGTVTVSANATDNIKMGTVQFKLNGANLGSELTVAPYNFSWNSTTVSNGSYTLAAVAQDSAGNEATASISVTVSNTVTPPPSSDLTVYQDAVASPWIDASWNATITFQSAEKVYAGSRSIKVVQNAWGALRLHSGPWDAPANVTTASYSTFEFAVFGGSVGLSVGVFFENDLNQQFPAVKYIWVPTNQWKVISLPISQLNPKNQTVHRVIIQDLSGRQRTYYVDNIRFVGATQSLTKSETSTGTTESTFVPGTFSLEQNYPNPFNPSTAISYSLPEAAEVTLEVFNTLGQLVETLVSGPQMAGQYQVPFNASSVASGVYFYRIAARPLSGVGVPFVETRRMTLTK
ncbi:MAG: Ig-like domain-containing protein, partial [Bacteroidota bacterium]